MGRTPFGAVLLATAIVAVTACNSSQVRVPSNASIVYHGPMMDMKGAMPRGPGTVYIVDAATNHTVGAFYVPGPEDAKDGQTYGGLGGLKQGKTYTIYFSPSPQNNAPTTAKAIPAQSTAAH